MLVLDNGGNLYAGITGNHTATLAYLGNIAGVEVCQFNGKGCTLVLFSAITVEGVAMHQQLGLGDASHRFSSGSVKAWVESLGLPKTRENQTRTSRSTGDVYKTIVFGLQSAEATIGIDIPAGFAADLASGRGARLQVLVDGTSANSANVAQGYVGLIVQGLGQDLGRTDAPAHRRTVGVDLQARAWFNPDLKSRVYNVPAVAGLIIMLMGLSLTSMAVVREREMGTLEQLMVSPLRPVELIIGKTLPVVLVTALDLVLVSAVAILWFHVPLRGSLLLLATGSLCFILAAIGLGLLISTISATQQEAFMTMFFFLLPVIILGGFMFPVANMPVPFQWLSLLDPLRHPHVRVLRQIHDHQVRPIAVSLIFLEFLEKRLHPHHVGNGEIPAGKAGTRVLAKCLQLYGRFELELARSAHLFQHEGSFRTRSGAQILQRSFQRVRSSLNDPGIVLLDPRFDLRHQSRGAVEI